MLKSCQFKAFCPNLVQFKLSVLQYSCTCLTVINFAFNFILWFVCIIRIAVQYFVESLTSTSVTVVYCVLKLCGYSWFGWSMLFTAFHDIVDFVVHFNYGYSVLCFFFYMLNKLVLIYLSFIWIRPCIATNKLHANDTKV